MHALLACLVALALAATSATADPVALSYKVDSKSFKSVAATDTLDFTLYDDAACTNLVSTTSLSAAAPGLLFTKVKGIRVKKGPKPAKSVLIETVIDPGVFPGTPYLAVTTSGATPLVGLPGSCQVQAGQQAAGVVSVGCPLTESVVGFGADGSPICKRLGPSGPLVNIEPTDLVGWEECYRHTFAGDPQDSVIGTILAVCDKANLLMGCREVGTTTLDVVAFAPRNDVVPPTGDASDDSQNANGAEWYYNGTGAEAWGFAGGGSAVNNNSCDVAATDSELRLCVHVTDGAVHSTGGHRCGNASFILDDWEWLLYHKD